MDRFRWHVVTALTLGAACSIATGPFAKTPTVFPIEPACGSTAIAWSLVFFSTILAVLPVLPSVSPKVSDGVAAVSTFVLSALAGAVNAVVVFTVSELWTGRFPAAELPLVLVFSIPFGGIPGAAYGVVLGLGTWLVRRRLKAPASALDAGRPLVVLVGVVALVTSAFVLASTGGGDVWPAWPFLIAVDLGIAAVCLVTAARHAQLAGRIASWARDRSGAIEITETADATVPGGLPHVVSGKSWGAPAHQVLRLTAVEGSAAYRGSTASTPVLSLAASPGRAVRALWIGAAVLAILAVGLGACIAQAAPHAAKVYAECGL